MLSFFFKPFKKFRTPTLLQVEHTECGVVALAMVFGYFKKWFSIEYLRDACGVSRDGSNALNLLKFAREVGFDSHGYSLELEELKQMTSFPMIIHWKFNHFIVIEKIRGKKFWVNDPATGRQVLHEREVDESFTGVALTFQPNDSFTPSGPPPSWTKSLLSYASEIKGGLLISMALGLALVVPGALMPILSIVFIDYVLVQGFSDWLPILIGSIAVLAILQFLLNFLQQTITLVFQTRLSIALNSRLLKKAMGLPLSFFSQRSASEIAGRSQLVDNLAGLITGPLGKSFIGLMTASVYCLIMFFFEVNLTFIVLGIALLNLLYFSWQVRRVRELNQAVTREASLNTGEQLQALQLIPEVKISGLEDNLLKKLIGRKIKWLNESSRLTIKRTIIESLPTFLNSGSYAVILFFGGHKVLEGQMSFGVLVAFQGLMMQFLTPIQQMLSHFADIQETQGNIDRIDDIFSQTDVSDKSDTDVGKEKQAQISFPVLELKNVTFGYQKLKPPLLQDFNLKVGPGKWVAFVGASGSGKSTIARLLSRLYKPWSGSIEIGGIDIDKIDPKDFSKIIAFVDQKIVLFNASISENLSMWNNSLTFEQLTKAAKTACIHDWIVNRPTGYEHKISEDGSNLSGGEKARIEIARALAMEPSLVVLDEATAGLDPETENILLQSIRQNCAGGIIISHKIEPIKLCDEIIVFEEGQIVQRGSHQELVSINNGLYRKLFSLEST
jgi:NHLM bacteriocin system ABC transporter peptidase/ATP-binding protein